MIFMKQDMSLEDLLTRAQNGDEYAFQLLLEEFNPLISYYARKSRYSYEDCKQVLRIAFWKAIPKVKVDDSLWRKK